MTIKLKLAPLTNVLGECCIIIMDGEPVAALYPQPDGKSVQLVSAHIQEHVYYGDNERESVPIPALTVSFDPKPFAIRDGKLVRL